MPEINKESMVRRVDRIVTAEMDGETVMMHAESGCYFGFGEVGTMIWALMEAPIHVAEIVRLLMESYDVTPKQCEEETIAFLNELHTHGIIDVNGAESE